jgi:Uma2 family endonuclease
MVVEGYRFTRADYHRMGEIGIFAEDDPVELIDGQVVVMSPIGRRHRGGVNRLNHLFMGRVGERAMVSVQNPVQLDDHSEPEPDIALLRPRADFYRDADATPEDILLLIEVAESSLDYDRRVKAPLYARSGIPESWIANLIQDHLLVHWDPSPAGYGTMRILRRGETIRPSAFPDLELTVDEILD